MPELTLKKAGLTVDTEYLIHRLNIEGVVLFAEAGCNKMNRIWRAVSGGWHEDSESRTEAIEAYLGHMAYPIKLDLNILTPECVVESIRVLDSFGIKYELVQKIEKCGVCGQILPQTPLTPPALPEVVIQYMATETLISDLSRRYVNILNQYEANMYANELRKRLLGPESQNRKDENLPEIL